MIDSAFTPVQWYIDGVLTDNSTLTEDFGIVLLSNNTHLTVMPPTNFRRLQPSSFIVSCAPPGSPEAFYANFTLIGEVTSS